MIVRDDAFDELLDRAALAEERGAEAGDGEERRRQFALEVDRAVKRALARDDGRTWHTQTSRRHRCRLYFFRHAGRLYLLACVPLDGAPAAAAHST